MSDKQADRPEADTVEIKISTDDSRDADSAKAAQKETEEKVEEIIPEVKAKEVINSQPEVANENIETEIEVSTKEEAQEEKVEEPQVENKSTILRPSAAAIIEENRQRQLRKAQEEQLAKKENDIAPLVMRPDVKPKKDLTVWERAWHRYGGYTDEVMNGHS